MNHVESLAWDQFSEMFGYWHGGPLKAGWTPLSDTMVIVQLLRWKNPLVIVEIGTCLGDMTANFCHYSHEDAEILTVDICKEMSIRIPKDQRISGELQKRADVGRHTNCFGNGDKAIQIFCDSMMLDWRSFPRIDFVFIDGNHRENYVRRDTEQAFDRLNDSGVIVWHDYSNAKGTTKVVKQFSRTSGVVHHVEGRGLHSKSKVMIPSASIRPEGPADEPTFSLDDTFSPYRVIFGMWPKKGLLS